MTKRTARQRSLAVEAARRYAYSQGRYPNGYPEEPTLIRKVLEKPDDDLPRWEYAAWLKQRTSGGAADENAIAKAHAVGRFIAAQLAAAQTRRADLRANPVIADDIDASCADVIGDLAPLIEDDLVREPWCYRGFVEHVAVAAEDFLEVAEELFRVAPIRHLTLTGLPAVVGGIAASEYLAGIRSLVLRPDDRDDAVTDETIAKLVASPHLASLAYLRIEGPHHLTTRAYETIVTAPQLANLSYFTVRNDVLTCWAEPIVRGDDSWKSLIERPTDDPRDTPSPVVLRPEDWIVELERSQGYVPCLHPERYYGGYNVAIEAVTEHPIAVEPGAMAQRGKLVEELGPKPSFVERRHRGECAMCGNPDFEYEPGVARCRRCGTGWLLHAWSEKLPPVRTRIESARSGRGCAVCGWHELGFEDHADPYGDPLGVRSRRYCRRCGVGWLVEDEQDLDASNERWI